MAFFSDLTRPIYFNSCGISQRTDNPDIVSKIETHNFRSSSPDLFISPFSIVCQKNFHAHKSRITISRNSHSHYQINLFLNIFLHILIQSLLFVSR